MQIGSSNSVDKAKILGLVRHYTNGDINDPTDADILAYVNRSLHNWQVRIIDIYPAVRLKGQGFGINLVAGTSNYAFATDYVSIDRIEVNYSGSTNAYRVAKVVDLRSSRDPLKNLEQTTDRVSDVAEPVVYVLNDKLYLKYFPANSVTNGIIVYGGDIQTEMTSTATDEPIIPEHFHDGLCVEAAIMHLIPKASELLPELEKRLAESVAGIPAYFRQHILAQDRKIVPRSIRRQRLMR